MPESNIIFSKIERKTAKGNYGNSFTEIISFSFTWKCVRHDRTNNELMLFAIQEDRELVALNFMTMI